jgi:hypothetical protein
MIRRAVLVLLTALGPAPLAAQGLYYEGGLSVATGTYIFAERTTSWAVATGIAVGSPKVTFRASVPVYFQNTTLVSLSGPGGGLPTGGSSSGAVADSGAARKGREDGGGGPQAPMGLMAAGSSVEVPASAVTGYETALGDPTMQVAWRAVDRGRTGVTASVLAKAPVADTATFGTGEWDVGAGVAVNRWIGRSVVVGLDATYWHLGDMPTLAFQDPVSGTASMTYYGAGNWGGGLSLSASTSALDGYDGPAWVGAHLLRSSDRGGWGLSAAVGLTETTSDVTVGLTWRVRLTAGG